MRRTSFSGWPCSLARTVDLLGDRWTPLVLREAFYGVRRFDQFQAGLGIARNTLAERLARLVDEGLLRKEPYQRDPVRHEYVLTEKGADCYPVLAAMAAWGDRWLDDGAGRPVTVHHTTCGHDTDATWSARSAAGRSRTTRSSTVWVPASHPGWPDDPMSPRASTPPRTKGCLVTRCGSGRACSRSWCGAGDLGIATGVDYPVHGAGTRSVSRSWCGSWRNVAVTRSPMADLAASGALTWLIVCCWSRRTGGRT